MNNNAIDTRLSQTNEPSHNKRLSQFFYDYQRRDNPQPTANYKNCVQFKSLACYVDALFERYARLILIRLDLSYRAETFPFPTIEQAQNDMRHFLHNMNHKPELFSDQVGYVWKLECSANGFYHFHVLLFFTNERLNNDAYRGEQIGKYWVDVITQGYGTYFNCNRRTHFQQYQDVCIGRVEYHETEKRMAMLGLLAYFSKGDQGLPEALAQRIRTIGKGVMPKPKEAYQGGRPRIYKGHLFTT